MSWIIWACALMLQAPTAPVAYHTVVVTPVMACNYSGQALHTMSYADLRCLSLSGMVPGLTMVTDAAFGEWIAFNPDTPDSNAYW